jgi:hypothetical protein
LPKEDIQETSPDEASAKTNVQRTSRPRSEWEQLVSNRKVILLMLFFVTGALGLPLLWLSPAFNATEKVAWSLLNLLYTLMLIGLCVAICYWAYSQVMLSI